MYNVHYYPALTTENKTRLRKVSFLCGVRPTNHIANYRVMNIVEGLAKLGISCYVFWRSVDREQLAGTLDADLLVVQRERYKDTVEYAMNLYKDRKIPIVYDTDDLVFDEDSIEYDPIYRNCCKGKAHHMGRDKDEQLSNFLVGVKQFKRALVESNFFTSTSERLSERASQFVVKTYVIPNTINNKEYNFVSLLNRMPRYSSRAFSIGYFSGSASHKTDFEECESALYKIMFDSLNVHFVCVGPVELSLNFKAFNGRFHRLEESVSHYDMFYYMRHTDVNIAPLEQNNPFVECKSEIKVTEAGMVETPVIASPTHAYRTVIRHCSNGLLASGETEWYDSISSLLIDRRFSRSLGESARRSFLERFYINNVIHDVVGVYEEIVEHFKC